MSNSLMTNNFRNLPQNQQAVSNLRGKRLNLNAQRCHLHGKRLNSDTKRLNLDV